MRRVTSILALSLGVMAAGCGLGSYDPGTTGGNGNGSDPGTTGGNGNNGGGGGGGGGGVPTQPGQATPPTARQLFDTNVLPLLGACSSCHAGAGIPGAPVFLGADQTQFYSSLVGSARFVNNKPDQSVLVTHKHGAQGTDLTVPQLKYVTDWLTQENVERVLPDPPTVGNVAAMQLAAFAKCMNATDFTASGMNDLQNQETAGDGGQCWSCHGQGLYVYLSQTATDNLTYLKVNPTLSKFAESVSNADGSFKDILPSYRFRDRGQQPGHPPYILSSARSAALDSFFQKTYAHWKAGNCP